MVRFTSTWFDLVLLSSIWFYVGGSANGGGMWIPIGERKNISTSDRFGWPRLGSDGSGKVRTVRCRSEANQAARRRGLPEFVEEKCWFNSA